MLLVPPPHSIHVPKFRFQNLALGCSVCTCSTSYSELYFEALFHMFCGHLIYISGLPTHTSIDLAEYISCIWCWRLLWCIWVVIVVSGWLVRISFVVICVFLGHFYNPISLSRPHHTRSYRPLWLQFGVYIVGGCCCSFG